MWCFFKPTVHYLKYSAIYSAKATQTKSKNSIFEHFFAIFFLKNHTKNGYDFSSYYLESVYLSSILWPFKHRALNLGPSAGQTI
jgi:hypothetical protein